MRDGRESTGTRFRRNAAPDGLADRDRAGASRCWRWAWPPAWRFASSAARCWSSVCSAGSRNCSPVAATNTNRWRNPPSAPNRSSRARHGRARSSPASSAIDFNCRKKCIRSRPASKAASSADLLMPIPALVWGIWSGHTIWFPVNLLAGMVVPGLSDLPPEKLVPQLEAFHPWLFVGAGVMHVVMSIGFGLVGGVLLPTLPRDSRRPAAVWRPDSAAALVRRKSQLDGPGESDAQPLHPVALVCRLAIGVRHCRFDRDHALRKNSDRAARTRRRRKRPFDSQRLCSAAWRRCAFCFPAATTTCPASRIPPMPTACRKISRNSRRCMRSAAPAATAPMEPTGPGPPLNDATLLVAGDRRRTASHYRRWPRRHVDARLVAKKRRPAD